MAEVRLQQTRQARGRCGAKGRDQVIGLQIEQRLVHTTSLSGTRKHSRHSGLRNIS